MKRSFLKAAVSMALVLAMMTALAACGPKTDTDAQIDQITQSETKAGTAAEIKKEPVKIKYPTYRVGTHVSALSEKKLLDDFKAKFGSEVEVVVEEIPSDQTYTDKMKILAASGDLPDIVEGKNGVNDILIKGNLVLPLDEYLNADPQWKAEIGDDAIKANTRDGKCWSISNAGQLVGYFYNKEMFDKAGIKPAETWDEFMSNCEKLKAAGFTPLALMTGENAWTTNLILASIIGTSGDAGNSFMNTSFPRNFETPEVIKGLGMIQTMLQKYTTKDALGAVYASAANNFLQGKAAIIANGPWMIPDFSNKEKAPEGFDKKVGVAMYPDAGMFSAYEVGYMLCSKTPETKEAAVKFLKFKTGAYAQQVLLEMNSITPLTANVKPSEDFIQKNPLFMDTVALGGKAKSKYVFLDTINFANVSDAWKTLYPELVFNRSTPEGMAKKLSEIAAKSK